MMADVSVSAPPRHAPSRLGRLRDRAIDATARNPSIRFLRADRRALDLAALDPWAIWRTLNAGQPIDVQGEHLLALDRHVRRHAEETGLHDGAIGLLFLDGPIGTAHIRSPVFLLPVTLRGQGDGWRVRARAAPMVNPALLVTLRRQAGIGAAIEEAALALLRGADPDEVAHDLAELLRREGLGVRDTATWSPVPPRSIRDTGPDDLCLVRHAVLAAFPQSQEAIASDLDALIEPDRPLPPAVRELLGTSPERPPIPAVDAVPDADRGVVLPSNGAQDQILAQARRRHGTVVRGPPGTGKSQLIANLASDAMHHGERALIVCQKKAALDVVLARLQGVGIGHRALRIHDPVADRDDAFARLRRLAAMPPGSPLDLGDLPERIDTTIKALDDLVGRFEIEREGIDVRWLYAHADPTYRPRMRRFRELRAATLHEADEAGAAVAAYLDDIRHLYIGHAWKDRRDFSGRHVPSRQHLEQAIDRLRTLLALPFHLSEPGRMQAMLDHLQRDPRDVAAEERFSRGLPGDHEALMARYGKDGVESMVAALRRGREIDRLFDSLGRALRKDTIDAMRQRAQQRPETVRRRLSTLRRGLDDYDAMVQLDRDLCVHRPTVQRLIVEAARVLGEEAATDLRQEALHVWIRDMESRHPELRGDAFRSYTRLRDRLARLMLERRAAEAASLHAPRHAIEPGTLHHLLAVLDADNGPTLHSLLHSGPLGDAALELAGCWMMSPEAVSAILPLSPGLFDIVIFDEASQLDVARALPSMARGGRVVVAGDEKQLPPFDLFRSHDDHADIADLALHARSLLTAAAGTWGVQMLEWHYRSRHQQLVEFSNRAYYGGRLKVPPSLGEARPLHWHAVDGRWEHRTNQAEAAATVELADQVLADGHSLGIIAFNRTQRDAIEDAVQTRIGQSPEFAAMWNGATEAPFLKNIENVQGDERDVIIFSTTYGPDARGRLASRFGSFNLPGGEHRLNVALTRAREAIHVVTSIDPDRMDVDGSTNLGPRHLQAFLRYARAAARGDHVTAGRVLDDVGHENGADVGAAKITPLQERIQSRLEEAGYQVSLQVGMSGHRIDLAVHDPADPTRLRMAIECDGDNFRGACGARERDVARPRALEARGWRIERTWARNAFRHPEKEAKRLLAAVEAACGPPHQKTMEPVAA